METLQQCECVVNESMIEEIIDYKTEGDEPVYKVKWKESWVRQSRLKNCINHISSYFTKQIPQKVQHRSTNDEDEETVVEESVRENTKVEDSQQQDCVSTQLVIEETVVTEFDTRNFVDNDNDVVVCDDDYEIDITAESIGLQEDIQTIDLNEKLDTAMPIHPQEIVVLVKPSSQTWYTSSKVKQHMSRFHDKFAKTPQIDIKDAKSHHNILIQQLENELKKMRWCKKLEYTGSSYEGLKISLDDLEFDVMFIMEGKDLELNLIDGRDGYCNLRLTDLSNNIHQYKRFLSEDRVLSPIKMIQKFKGDVQTILNNLNQSDMVKLRQHGPAVQMDVFKKDKSFWFSVDLVPSIEIGETRYVPKPITEPDSGKVLENAWRSSFSKEEKAILSTVDDGNGCRRQVLRILKALCKQESTLKTLNSYYLKTVFFHMIDKRSLLDLSWNISDIPERVLDMLGIIEYFLNEKRLPQYFLPSMNLFESINETKLAYIKTRVQKLRSSENALKKALSF